MKPDFITACPYCYAKNPKGRPSFFEYDPEKPGIVICQACGEMKADEVPAGPKFYFTHYEEPKTVEEELAHEVSLFLSAEDSLAALNEAQWKWEKVIFEKLLKAMEDN